MLRSITAKKVNLFTSRIDEATRAISAALVTGKVEAPELREMLASVKHELEEVGKVYNALVGKANSIRNLAAAAQNPHFDEAISRVVEAATRLDLMRTAIAAELGESPDEPELDPNQSVTAEDITKELGGGEDIPVTAPKEVDPEQPNVAEDTPDFSKGEVADDIASVPPGQLGVNEDEELDFGDDQNPDDLFNEDEAEAPVEGDLPPAEDEALPIEDEKKDVPVTAAKKVDLRKQATARKVAANSVQSVLPRDLFDFTGNK